MAFPFRLSVDEQSDQRARPRDASHHRAAAAVVIERDNRRLTLEASHRRGAITWARNDEGKSRRRKQDQRTINMHDTAFTLGRQSQHAG